MVAQQGLQERAGGVGRKGIDPELPVVALVAPRLLILGPVVHREQDGRGRQALDEGVEQRLGLGVDPVEVLEDEEQGLRAALPEQHALDGLERPRAARDRVEPRELMVLRERVEHPQERRDTVLQSLVEGEDVAGHLRAHRAHVVLLRDLEVALEEVDHRQVRCRLAVRDGARLEHEPALGPMRVDELVEQARLADPGLPQHRHDLAAAAPGLLERLAELIDLRVATDEAGEPPRHRGLQARAGRAGAHDLVDGHGLGQALDRRGPERFHLDEPLGPPQGGLGDEGGAGAGELLHPRRQMRRLADRRVVHVEVVADRAHHDVAGVEADPDLDIDPVPLADVLGVVGHRVLHPQRGIAGPRRVVFVSQRRPEERHDAVAHDLIDGALVAVHGLHHQLEDRVDDLPRFFRIPVRQQLHRALQVREEHRHLLALTFQRALRGEDLLREMPGGVRLGRG